MLKQLSILSLFCFLALLVSLILEHIIHLTPCVLCQIQRCLLFLMLLVSMLQSLLYSKDSTFFILKIIFSILLILGFSLSLRHVWLQSLPMEDINVHCLPSLQVLWQWMPVHKIILHMLQGDALCHQIKWRFMGLSVAMWLSVFYFLLILYWGWFLLKTNRSLFKH